MKILTNAEEVEAEAVGNGRKNLEAEAVLCDDDVAAVAGVVVASFQRTLRRSNQLNRLLLPARRLSIRN